MVVAVDEVALHVEYVGKAPGESRPEIHAGASQYADHAARHIFAAMIARALNHGESAGIAHGKSFARSAGGVQLSAGRTIQTGIAHDHRFTCDESGTRVRPQDDPAARHALANVVVRLAFQIRVQAACIPDPEALPGGSLEIHDQRRRAHSVIAPSLGDLTGYPRTDRAMKVTHVVAELAP